MKEKLEALKQKALADLEKVSDAQGLEQMRVAYLGKKSELASILKGMAQLSAEERPIIGQLGNSIRSSIEQAFESARKHVTELETQKKIEAETLDVTLPAAKLEIGGLHPLTKVQTQLEDIFLGWALPLPKVRRSKPTTTTSPRSTPRNFIRHATRKTPSTSPTRCCFVPRPVPCRFTPWKTKSRRSASFRPAVYTVPTLWTPPIRRCSTSARVLSLTRESRWPI